jgi:quercetin dioxygenase-like cupin family protein
MVIIRGKDAHGVQGKMFTGLVRVEMLHPAEKPNNLAAYRVVFSPGARTYWHSHAEGQTLFVLSGQGRVGVEGQQGLQVGPGDTVFFLPGEKHWHGAELAGPMEHIAVSLGGKTEWLAPVTDEEYEQGF